MPALSASTITAMLTKAGVVTGGGDTLEGIMDNASINGSPLSDRQREVIRSQIKKLEKPKPKKRPGYRDFIEWIALNDDVDVSSEGGALVSITMVAHLFDKDIERVTSDVITYGK